MRVSRKSQQKLTLSQLFGASVYLLVLDLFLERRDAIMNLREVARLVDRNPGSVTRVMPRLIEVGVVSRVRVGKERYVYQLNKEEGLVKLLLEFRESLQTVFER